MAQMFPERLSDAVRDDRSRRAEVRLYDALERAAPSDWRVFHSVAWLSRDRAQELRDGESDFIIVHPRSGLLIVEVKGGGVEQDGRSGQWWSTDAEGQPHAITDPFAQAARGKHALIAHLRETPAFRDRWVPAAHAVAFPDLGRLALPTGPHAPPELIITGEDLERIGERVEEIVRYASPAPETRFDARDASEVERLLAPRRRARVPTAVAAREADRQIVTLTEAQYRVLDFLSRVRRVVVSGPAGSGKSLIAAEQARRLAGQGFRTLYVCFNRPLADVMAAELGASGASVHTFHDLCRRLGSQAGLLDDAYVQDASPDFFERLPGVLLEALERLPDVRFDAVVVDEGQDFEAEWWALLELAMSDPEGSILYVFQDETQRLADGDHTLPADLTPITLDGNVRNTRAIQQLAGRFAPRDPPSHAAPDGRPVKFVKLTGTDELEPVLSTVLHGLVREEQFRPEEIAVLSGRGRASSVLTNRERIGAYRCGPLPVLPGVVAVDTIRRFKGLDSRVVVLVEVDHLLDQPALLYVGITRARTHLVVLGAREAIEAMGG